MAYDDDDEEDQSPVTRDGGWIRIRGMDGKRVCVRSVSAIADADEAQTETVIHAAGRQIVVNMPLDQVADIIGSGGGRPRW